MVSLGSKIDVGQQRVQHSDLREQPPSITDRPRRYENYGSGDASNVNNLALQNKGNTCSSSINPVFDLQVLPKNMSFFTKDQITNLSFKSQISPVKKQIGPCNCALASLSHFLNLEEMQLEKILGRDLKPKGMTLDDLVNFMKNDVNLKKLLKNVRIYRPENSKELRLKIYESFQFQKENKIILNFHMPIIYPDIKGDFGHFSPIIAYSNDQACIGDVWPKCPDFTWASYEDLVESMEGVDSDSGERRGMVLFDLV